MEKSLADMRDELDLIKEDYLDNQDPMREKISTLITNLNNIALTKRRMQNIRRIWKDYKNSKNWHVLVSELDKFLKEKPINEEQDPVEFDERKLKLICVDFIS
jgi:sulfur relay (sulfurtransferase) DsrC/TusE family protein